jgi:hypothetical protein
VRIERNRNRHHEQEKESGEGNRTQTTEFAKARNSIRVEHEGDSNEIDESDLPNSKQNDPRTSIEDQIMISDEPEKQRINL